MFFPFIVATVPSQQTSIASSQQFIKSETEAKPKVQLQPDDESGEGNKAETNSDNATHEAEKSQQETSDLATQQVHAGSNVNVKFIRTM